jgi:hypothetical protein
MGAVRAPTKKLGSWARRVFRMPKSRSLRDVPDDCDRRNNEGYAKRASQSGENKTRIHHTPQLSLLKVQLRPPCSLESILYLSRRSD